MVMRIPGTTVSILSSPGKMPSKSFSLPAIRSCPSAYFGKGAICGESKDNTTCYASKRAYTWPVVVNALNARYQWAIRASMDAATGDEFVQTMTEAIVREALRQQRRHKRINGNLDGFQPVFRLHDSGDLFSPSYALLWARIAERCDHVSFWIPTRQWRSKNLHMQAALATLAALPNVAVRPSALVIEVDAPVVPGLAAGTGVRREGYNCPASAQGNKCGDCRQCWQKDVPVYYHLH